MTDDRSEMPFDDLDDEESGMPRGMPQHEMDRDDTVGAGIMGAGGTAVDRGTGDVYEAGRGADEGAMYDEQNVGITAGPPAGGAQSYAPAVFADDEDGGSLPDA